MTEIPQQLLYGGDAWCDIVLTAEDWLSISPTGHEGGVLCFSCIARRLTEAGRSDVPMMITSGPFSVRTERPRGQFGSDEPVCCERHERVLRAVRRVWGDADLVEAAALADALEDEGMLA